MASPSFHRFPNQDVGLEEMKRMLKSNGTMIIIEIDPNTGRGKWLKICESILHTGAKFYEPLQLRKKVEEHGLRVLAFNSTISGYFLIATKITEKEVMMGSADKSTVFCQLLQYCKTRYSLFAPDSSLSTIRCFNHCNFYDYNMIHCCCGLSLVYLKNPNMN